MQARFHSPSFRKTSFSIPRLTAVLLLQLVEFKRWQGRVVFPCFPLTAKVSKLRGCDLVNLRVRDITHGSRTSYSPHSRVIRSELTNANPAEAGSG